MLTFTHIDEEDYNPNPVIKFMKLYLNKNYRDIDKYLDEIYDNE